MNENCVFCGKEMEPAMPGGLESYQPWGGGEVRFIFCFGSMKFDNNPATTEFRGLVCDECAEDFVDRMQEV